MNWVLQNENWVLCRIFLKSRGEVKKKKNSASSSKVVVFYDFFAEKKKNTDASSSSITNELDEHENEDSSNSLPSSFGNA
jgi:hypothetical protein